MMTPTLTILVQYLEKNPDAILDIYYFNNRGVNDHNINSLNKSPEEWKRHDKYVESLRWYEKNNIAAPFNVEDAIRVSRQNDCGCNFRFDQSYISKSILFEIKEGKSSSLWFLLPDDKMLLYLLEGEKVLNFDYKDFGESKYFQYPCVMFDGDGNRINTK
jgi:hypothetical protein